MVAAVVRRDFYPPRTSFMRCADSESRDDPQLCGLQTAASDRGIGRGLKLIGARVTWQRSLVASSRCPAASSGAMYQDTVVLLSSKSTHGQLKLKC